MRGTSLFHFFCTRYAIGAGGRVCRAMCKTFKCTGNYLMVMPLAIRARRIRVNGGNLVRCFNERCVHGRLFNSILTMGRLLPFMCASISCVVVVRVIRASSVFEVKDLRGLRL